MQNGFADMLGMITRCSLKARQLVMKDPGVLSVGKSITNNPPQTSP